MVLYLSIILVAVALATLFNCLFNQPLFNCSPVLIFLIIVGGVVVEIAIQGLIAFIVHSLPNKLFYKDKKIFVVGKKERKFYDKLHIKAWKDKVLELGALGGFRKNKLYEPDNPEYLNLFVIECNKGFMVHFVGSVFAFLILLYPHPKFFLCVGLPIALVCVLLNTLSMMVLRYNVPKLIIAYERAKKTSELKAKNKLDDKIENNDKHENVENK